MIFKLSRSARIAAGAPRLSLPSCDFSPPPPLQLLLGGFLGEGKASQLLLCHPLTHQKWECCLRWWKIRGDHRDDRIKHFLMLLLHLLVRQNGHPPGRSLGELQILWRVVRIVLIGTPWAWASFHGAFLPIILHFGGNFRDLNFSYEAPLIRHRLFPLLCHCKIA